MREYNSKDWIYAAKSTEIPLTTRDTIELDVVSPGVITIYGVCEDGTGTPIVCGAHHVHIKTKFHGFTALEVQSSKELGYRLMGRPGQLGEPMDDRAPPAPKEPTNILQQMRSVIKQELAANRENFLQNDTPFSGYEVDDDEDTFEEDMLDAKLKAVEAQKAKLASKPNPEPVPDPDTTPKPQEKANDDK